jgi:Putative Flp pilus-assembly TadE/G-like
MTRVDENGPDERGSVSVFVVGVLLALIVTAGLVFDGGSILAAHREADGEAEGAARAAAQEISGHALHTGTLGIDPATAQTAADSYLAPYHHAGVVVVNGDTVTVTVIFSVPMQVLSIVGVGSKTVIGTGTASAFKGTNTVAGGP